MTFKGTTTNVTNGIELQYGDWSNPGEYNFDLMILGEGITYSASGDSLAGTGNYLYFEMFTSDSTTLASGTYNFNANSTAAGIFDIGEGFQNYNMSTGTSDDYLEATTGTVTIDRDGDTYIIDIEISDGAGGTITAHYEGTLVKRDER